VPSRNAQKPTIAATGVLSCHLDISFGAGRSGIPFYGSGNRTMPKNRYKAEIRQNKAGKFTKSHGFR
jgi:hypothetical protein